jgi:hypothetical protein
LRWDLLILLVLVLFLMFRKMFLKVLPSEADGMTFSAPDRER